jgi:hypothetical protein
MDMIFDGGYHAEREKLETEWRYIHLLLHQIGDF